MSSPLTPRPSHVPRAAENSRCTTPSRPAFSTITPDPKTIFIPERLRDLEALHPQLFIIDDAVFRISDTASILGIEPSRLEKWRQRERGPSYLQYEKNGHVSYEFSALIAFKEAHRICPSRRPIPEGGGNDDYQSFHIH